MFEAAQLSKLIRDKKKKALRADMDDAGQDTVAPETAWQAKMDADVNATLDNPDHEPASADEMGENDSSQDQKSLKRAMGIINKFFSTMMIEK